MVKLYLISRYITVLLVFTTSLAWSQGRTITGTVTAADDGSPLPGVNVIEVGTNNGAVTGMDGAFSLIVGDNASLVFSFVGYQSRTVTVGNQTTINVSLDPDVTSLSEVVVIGYGAVQKRDATGAVASVKAEDFNVGVIASPEQLIQGRTAGVQVTQASGEPGAGVNIRIRGTSSVRGGNNPLFVVDGIPLTGDEVTPGGSDLGRGSSAARNPLNFLNPNDIESIDVLKDASATAIYGSRGANGVVIITTKSGRGKKRALDYSSNVSISRMANRFDLLNREQFLRGAESFGTDVAEIDFGADTDWQEQISRTAVSHKHDLAFANNYKLGNYRVAFGYEDQEGVIKNSGLERLTGRLNTNNNFFNDKLKINAQLTFSRVQDQAAPITNTAGFEGDLLGATYMANPTWEADPTVQRSNTNLNPLSMLAYNQDNTLTNRSLINASAEYAITSDLSFKVNTGWDRANSTREAATSGLLNMGNGIVDNGRAAINEVDTRSDLLEAFFTYNTKLGTSSLSAVLGYSYQNFNRKGMDIRGWGFSGTNMDNMISDLDVSSGALRGVIPQDFQNFGFFADRFFIQSLFPSPEVVDLTNRPTVPVKSVTGTTFETFDELQSFFGRLNYTIKDKYLFTGTVRADGSTRFGGNNKYGIFPSLAAAWRISDEEFMGDFFNDLKLRVGYGITGNQEIPHNLHLGRQRYNGLGIESNGVINETGLADVAFPNPDLKWESTAQVNIGLDFGFLEGKFGGTIDYYTRTTSDILMQQNLAQPASQPFVWRNVDADIVNRGVELTLNYYAIDTDAAGLNFNFNISYNDNTVERFQDIVDTGEIRGQGLTGAFAQRIQEGQPLYAFFLRPFGGYDVEGNSLYPDGEFQQFLGYSPIPKYNLGFATNARFGNFDMSVFFSGQFGHYIYNNTANAFFTAGSLANGRNVTQDVLTSGESNINAPDVSTRFLEKGDFLRFQNFNLGYSIPVSPEGFIKSLRLSIAGQNLFVITSYSGLDPEVNTNAARNGVPSLGIDYTAYPRARTFTFGVNASF